jgi:endonuclease V-like protein UPF0215 family
MRALSNLIGIDDAPFARAHRGDVPVVGVVYASARLDGVLTTRVRRDGANSTERLVRMVLGSRFAPGLHAIVLQGIAVGGFNVVDIHALHELTGLPVLVVARHEPDLDRIRRALLTRIPGGARKWRLIERAGPMEAQAGVWVQRAGLTPAQSEALLRRSAFHGHLPEPIRVAHLIAGGMTVGASRGGA